MRVLMLHPYEAKIVKLEKAKLFTARCYTVVMKLWAIALMSVMLTGIFDSEAGVSLLWEHVPPRLWLACVCLIRAGIILAGDMTFKGEDLIYPVVRIREHKIKEVLGVAP